MSLSADARTRRLALVALAAAVVLALAAAAGFALGRRGGTGAGFAPGQAAGQAQAPGAEAARAAGGAGGGDRAEEREVAAATVVMQGVPIPPGLGGGALHGGWVWDKPEAYRAAFPITPLGVPRPDAAAARLTAEEPIRRLKMSYMVLAAGGPVRVQVAAATPEGRVWRILGELPGEYRPYEYRGEFYAQGTVQFPLPTEAQGKEVYVLFRELEGRMWGFWALSLAGLN